MLRQLLLISMFAVSLSSIAGGGGNEDTPCESLLKVVDADGSDVHIGAKVLCVESQIAHYTSPEGTVDLLQLGARPGDRLEISYISYETVIIDLDACEQLLEIRL